MISLQAMFASVVRTPSNLIIRECANPKQAQDCVKLANTGLVDNKYYQVLPIEYINESSFHPLPHEVKDYGKTTRKG